MQPIVRCGSDTIIAVHAMVVGDNVDLVVLLWFDTTIRQQHLCHEVRPWENRNESVFCTAPTTVSIH